MNRLAAAIMAPLMLIACAEATAATVEVTKDPNCGCCTEWVAHLRKNGFTVNVTDSAEQPKVSQRLGVPEDLRGCHSATIDGYVIEGHVPAADIRRLLAEKPKARGLAVPGMPMGSPGMDHGDMKQPYQTVLFGDGGTKVFAQH
jgi:hypothetical protein